MVKQNALSTLALCAAFFSLSVIALGAFTRLVDAGLGCPDWPGCYGHWVAAPLAGYKAWAEMIHRYFVGCLSLFIVGVISLVFKKKYRSRGNVILAFGLIFLLSYQILLGRWTVTLKLLPIIVTQHLLGGFLILSLLWLIYLNNRVSEISLRIRKNRLLVWAVLGLVLLFFQILLGAWTSTNYASLSCPDFPWCAYDRAMILQFKEAFSLISPTHINYEGGVLSLAARQTIQMTHRIGAVVVTIYFFIFLGLAIKSLKYAPSLMKILYGIVGLLCVQLCVGMVNVIFKLPLATAISHNLIAVVLLLSMITFIFKLAKAPSL